MRLNHPVVHNGFSSVRARLSGAVLLLGLMLLVACAPTVTSSAATAEQADPQDASGHGVVEAYGARISWELEDSDGEYAAYSGAPTLSIGPARWLPHPGSWMRYRSGMWPGWSATASTRWAFRYSRTLMEF